MVPTKYRSKWTQCRSGHNHQSKKEAERCNELVLLEKAGEIKDLEQQPKYQLVPSYVYEGKKVRGISYGADFAYWDNRLGRRVIEDVKGFKTKVYKLKSKMLKHLLSTEPDPPLFIET